MFVNPVIGFRSWKLDAGRVCLSGRIANVPWEFKKPTQAKCCEGFFKKPRREVGVHDSPHLYCTCGLYGYFGPERLDNFVITERSIFGAMVAWGNVVVHERGFRAATARPLALAYGQPTKPSLSDKDWENLARKIAENYSIPIIPLDDLAPYALTFGQSIDPDVLLGGETGI